MHVRIVCLPVSGDLVSVITRLYYVAMIIFHCGVWYCMLSLRYVCIRSSGIILIPKLPVCQILFFFLTHGEKLHTQSITHSITQLI